MTTERMNEYLPDIVSSPGETLQEILDDRGMTQAELSNRTGLARKTINEIIKGKNALTPETALLFERVFGVPARFWNNLEQNYREYLARTREQEEFLREADWAKSFPLSEMVKKRYIGENPRNPIEKVRILLQFFGVSSVAQWRETYSRPQFAYRRSKVFDSKPEPLSAWLRMGEIEAHRMELADYERSVFLRALESIRSLTNEYPQVFVPQIKKLCAHAGVAVVFVPELTRSSASGATRWLSPKTACIQLSLRYKTNDHLWFTFFHEAAHILMHGKKEVFLEAAQGTPEGEKEVEANRWARDFLIPVGVYKNFTHGGRRHYSKAKILYFAEEVGVAPGIVVGRLQHDELLPYTHCNDLKEKYSWEV